MLNYSVLVFLQVQNVEKFQYMEGMCVCVEKNKISINYKNLKNTNRRQNWLYYKKKLTYFLKRVIASF